MKVDKRTLKIWEKNRKEGWRFFEPHNATQTTPRTEHEWLRKNKYDFA